MKGLVELVRRMFGRSPNLSARLEELAATVDADGYGWESLTNFSVKSLPRYMP